VTRPAQTDPHLPPFHPRRTLLLIEQMDGGGLLLSSPHLPGWRTTARGPAGLAQAVEAAWRENAVRAYANGRGERYDLAEHADAEGRTGDGEWHDNRDGTWTSPAGSRWREDTATVQNLIANRAAKAPQ
jgi:hypothetical protein